MRRRLLAIAATFAALALICIVTIDQPIARWIASREVWPVWDRGVALVEVATGVEPSGWIGIAVLVGGVLATQLWWRRHARAWLLVALTHLVSRNLMGWLKFSLGRLRPLEWLAHPHSGGHTFFRGGVAFPSGHVVLVASLVVPIVVVWPRLRWLLVAVAFTMIARVAVDAHFVSDVLAGLALVAAVTWLCAAIVDRASPGDRGREVPRDQRMQRDLGPVRRE